MLEPRLVNKLYGVGPMFEIPRQLGTRGPLFRALIVQPGFSIAQQDSHKVNQATPRRLSHIKLSKESLIKNRLGFKLKISSRFPFDLPPSVVKLEAR